MMYDIDSVVEPRNCEWESDLSVIVWKYYLFFLKKKENIIFF